MIMKTNEYRTASRNGLICRFPVLVAPIAPQSGDLTNTTEPPM